jgi:hypothetical protein
MTPYVSLTLRWFIKKKKDWAGGMAHMVEHLPSKHEALSWNPSTTKKKLWQCVSHDCNPSSWESEPGGLHIPGQPGLHSQTLSQKQTNENYKSVFVENNDN